MPVLPTSRFGFSNVTDCLLSDLGERRIVEEVLRPRYARGGDTFGDDCAQIAVAKGNLVVTTDPCPPPMAHLLGFKDEFFRGWLLGTINLSDLAAAGAHPLGLLTSLILPSSMPLASLERLLDGIDECCAAAGTRVIGGNLKEGREVDVQATAIGTVSGVPLGRRGAVEGDVLFAAGPTGVFWAGVLALRAGYEPHKLPNGLLEAVQMPSAQLPFAQVLQRRGICRAAMDNSDGLGSSLNTLAATNGIQVLVDLDSIEFEHRVTAIASDLGIDPVRFALGWGDWNLVVAVAASDVDTLRDIAVGTGTALAQVGVARAGTGVRVVRRGSEIDLCPPDSERFALDSWFSAGIERYIELLLNFQLP